ncbi:MAG: PilZ domain-containing protein [Candidatus Polarisedimenticolaceae bacterium]|nr:PilZ domain-containing protein [Candidatus Polarisedimenticolaceae bacterium]
MSEQRKTPRTDICINIQITDSNGIRRTVKSHDVSNTGLFLSVDAPLPPIGSLIDVQVKGALGDDSEAPINQARVIRHTDTGIGLHFIFD